jgi:hypothetical protein
MMGVLIAVEDCVCVFYIVKIKVSCRARTKVWLLFHYYSSLPVFMFTTGQEIFEDEEVFKEEKNKEVDFHALQYYANVSAHSTLILCVACFVCMNFMIRYFPCVFPVINYAFTHEVSRNSVCAHPRTRSTEHARARAHTHTHMHACMHTHISYTHTCTQTYITLQTDPSFRALSTRSLPQCSCEIH